MSVFAFAASSKRTNNECSTVSAPSIEYRKNMQHSKALGLRKSVKYIEAIRVDETAITNSVTQGDRAREGQT